jgi:glycosyltransferase involved in cell wall biosynthesis
MKKILFISGLQIFPPESGGQLRSANLCKSLAKQGFNVQIYSFTGRKKEYLKLKQSANLRVDEKIFEYTNRNFLLGLIQFVFYYFKLPPLWITWLTKYHIFKELKSKIYLCDSIIVDFPYLHPLSSLTLKPFRINTHNVEHELFLNNKIISGLIKKIEIDGFRKSDSVFFCNNIDQSKFINHVPDLLKKSYILPNGLEIKKYEQKQDLRIQTRKTLEISIDQRVFLFTGSKYFPNREAYIFLQQWGQQNKDELIKRKVVILIVGTVCQNQISEEHFKTIGKVDSIMPYFAASDFGINPIIIGSGTNVKMAEYLAAHLPIVTTDFGARGFNLKNKKTCWIFERENLLPIIKIALRQNLDLNQLMTKTALQENMLNVDMSMALKSLNIQW